jgi:hypothetical protein
MNKFKIGYYVKSFNDIATGYWIVKNIFRSEGNEYIYVVCPRDKTNEFVPFFEHQLTLLEGPMFRVGESIWVNELVFIIKDVKLGKDNKVFYDVSFFDNDARIERTIEISEELFFIIHKN